MAVHLGGPVETGRGFVLHSADYFKAESTLPIDESVCLTATIDILRDIAKGTGPDKALLALGYAGWAPGQLESEIHANGWLNCPADPELIFDPEVDRKYNRALGKIGIDPGPPGQRFRPRLGRRWRQARGGALAAAGLATALSLPWPLRLAGARARSRSLSLAVAGEAASRLATSLAAIGSP